MAVHKINIFLSDSAIKWEHKKVVILKIFPVTADCLKLEKI